MLFIADCQYCLLLTASVVYCSLSVLSIADCQCCLLLTASVVYWSLPVLSIAHCQASLCRCYLSAAVVTSSCGMAVACVNAYVCLGSLYGLARHIVLCSLLFGPFS